jgi:hypothetical protein
MKAYCFLLWPAAIACGLLQPKGWLPTISAYAEILYAIALSVFTTWDFFSCISALRIAWNTELDAHLNARYWA